MTIITADPDGKDYWSELWGSRELLGMMVWRDIVVRYKQTAMGLSWALVRPLATMLVFSLVFGKLANLPSNGAPYALLVFAGLLPWLFFSAAFSDASNSVVGNANLVSKVYFPRLIIPLSSVLVGLVDFALAMLVYLAMSFFYGLPPGLHVLALPLFLVQLCLLILGCSLSIAALSVWYRDFRHLLPVVLQLGVYLSPVGFASTVIPEKWRLLYAFNPMVGIIDGFRWSLLGATQPLRMNEIGISCLVTLLLLWSGLRFFRRSEHRFSDAI
ncbi:phosphate ABC transporter permease [Herbaspirillum rubrisubalbicans]|uniref:Transport permease protein n=1 Tax=Herbaspirillum rubrisubalbicans TaxID=80842 RepID=A0ABX9BV72_9BURK|nr:phosphate ABC transporter permease [Herbaspirillum rubrisubalbicans]RAN44059.1 phosphate ABC transporter permease [Herbaspirillum rubrisubalbicans]